MGLSPFLLFSASSPHVCVSKVKRVPGRGLYKQPGKRREKGLESGSQPFFPLFSGPADVKLRWVERGKRDSNKGQFN